MHSSYPFLIFHAKTQQGIFPSYAGMYMAQDISVWSTKPNDQRQKKFELKNSKIMLSPKIIFKICVSQLQQQSIEESSLSPPTLTQASKN